MLLRAIAQKEEQALARLYDLYSSAIFGCLLQILGRREEAEEVLLEVFWQAWEQADRYDPERGAPFTWLFAIARSRASWARAVSISSARSAPSARTVTRVGRTSA